MIKESAIPVLAMSDCTRHMSIHYHSSLLVPANAWTINQSINQSITFLCFCGFTFKIAIPMCSPTKKTTKWSSPRVVDEIYRVSWQGHRVVGQQKEQGHDLGWQVEQLLGLQSLHVWSWPPCVHCLGTTVTVQWLQQVGSLFSGCQHGRQTRIPNPSNWCCLRTSITVSNHINSTSLARAMVCKHWFFTGSRTALQWTPCFSRQLVCVL